MPYTAMLIAMCDANLREYQLARAEYEQAIIYAKGDEQLIARCNNGLGKLLETMGEYKEAEKSYTSALRAKNKKLVMLGGTVDSKANPQTQRDLYLTLISLAAIYGNLGETHRLIGNYHNAQTELEISLKIRTLHKNIKETPTDIAVAESSLAVLFTDIGDFEKAEAHYDTAIKGFLEGAPENPGLILAKSEYAYIEFHLGKLKNAWTALDEAEQLAKSTVSKDHTLFANVKARKGVLLQLS
jgi:tetratricopeptide (TPR) repeat protein